MRITFKCRVKLACGISAAVMALGMTFAQPLHAAERQKVTFAISYTPISALTNYLYPAAALGYWKDEGIDVELVTTQGTGQVLQMLAAGAADMGLANPEPYIVARLQQNLQARAVGTVGAMSTWAVGVKPESPYKSLADLKGKNVGVTSLASGGIYFLKARAIESGLDPDKDINLVPVGFGASANEAYASGKVDAMLLWRSGFVTVENIGTKFRYLPRAQWEDDVYALLTLASDKMIQQKPEVVAKVLRGIAKSFEFTAAHPESAAALFEKEYPASVSQTEDRKKTFQNNLNLIRATMTDAGFYSDKFPKPPARMWGAQAAGGWDTIQDYLIKVKLIDKPLKADELFTDQFTKEANTFDKAAVEKQAKDYKIPQ